MIWFLRAVGWLIAVALMGAGTVLVLLRSFPEQQLVDQTRAMITSFVPYGILAWAAALLLLLVTTRKAWRLLALIPTLALCLQLVWLNGYLPRIPPASSGDSLRIVSFNTLYGKADPQATADMLAATRPDMIILLEASQALVDSEPMAAVLADYPHREGRLGQGYLINGYEDSTPTYVLSRRPFTTDAQLDSLHDQFVLSTTTRTDVPMTVIVTHLINMLHGTQRWSDEAEELAASVTAHIAEPMVVVGDFNATPDHITYSRILDAGLVDAASQAGAGWVPTFNADLPIPAVIPIDHALISPGMSAQRFRTIAVTGSDHRAIVVDVSVR